MILKSPNYYQELSNLLIKNKGIPAVHDTINYDGNHDPKLYIKTPIRHELIKNFMKSQSEINSIQFSRLINQLYQGKYDEEKQTASYLLKITPKFRKLIGVQEIDKWLNYLHGWSQVDGLCQSVFTAAEFEKDWIKWEELIISLSKDTNINKRRASLVLLTGPVRDSNNMNLRNLAFSIIKQLQPERDILITKAVSWLLRSLIKHHKNNVAKYLKVHQNELPAIALRETKRKLLTGKK